MALSGTAFALNSGSFAAKSVGQTLSYIPTATTTQIQETTPQPSILKLCTKNNNPDSIATQGNPKTDEIHSKDVIHSERDRSGVCRRFIAEIGDIARFSNHNALAKYTDLVWSQYQSGEFESEETKRLRTGNKYLCYYLIQAANLVRRYDSDYNTFTLKNILKP